MLNVMEERDIQIRGYVLRLPLDVLVVASANPEDYTNRGRIITPLKDRFGAEIRTHYPVELDDEVAVIRQEAHLVADVPDHLVEILARFTRGAARVHRRRPALRRLGAVRHRRRRDHRRRGPAPRHDPGRGRGRSPGSSTSTAAVDVLGGKIEFETGEEGRERDILAHLLRTATAETVRERLARHRPRASRRRASRAAPR